MTAVLSAADVLRRDRIMGSLDDNQINYSSPTTDWRAKYNEVADMLAETRAELDEFHHSSKELEEELIRELERTEKAQQDLKVKVVRAEADRDEWKGKFMSLQTTHNTTTASLQRELDKLRQEHQQLKIQLRELEMGNDDLERNERAVSSSLADVEAKYSRALEEKILLEHELLDKANLEEESQRLKDELRDANVEISILKDQLAAHASTASAAVKMPPPPDPPVFPLMQPPSEEDLLRTTPPPDMQLSDLVQDSDDLLSVLQTPRRPPSRPPTLLPFKPTKSTLADPKSANTSALPRSNTLPSAQLLLPSPRLSATRALVNLNSSNAGSSTSSNVVAASKSKGVQMVSEMRARVRNLEQKIHTRVPRLRMGSLTGRNNANAMTTSAIPSPSSISSSPSKTLAKASLEGRSSRSSLQRQSFDVETEKRKTPAFDTSGWVLIMEDSSPEQDTIKERRRPSSPTTRNTFRPAASTSTALPKSSKNKINPLAQSTINIGIRRPQSRLSAASVSTTTTSSSIPTPSSRPATPTFLPLPTSGSYTSGLVGLKRSMGPGSTPYAQAKRSSLGSNSPVPPMPPLDNVARERSVTMPPPPIRSSVSSNSTTSQNSKGDRDVGNKALPTLPIHANVTIRPSSKLSGSPMLSQSRIGRPSTGSNGRRSTGGEDGGFLDPTGGKRDVRPRSGSTNTGIIRNGM